MRDHIAIIRLRALFLGALLAAGCSDDPATSAGDAAVADTAAGSDVSDAAVMDTGSDSGTMPLDAGDDIVAADAGDGGLLDGAAQDAGSGDTGGGPPDVGAPDGGVGDTGAQDGGVQDTGVGDAEAQDTATQDGGALDAGVPDPWAGRPAGQCATSADCPPAPGGPECSRTFPGGVCLGCGGDGDCPAAAVCTDFASCAMECAAETDCPPGANCAAAGLCKARDCVGGVCPVALLGCDASGRCARQPCDEGQTCPEMTTCLAGLCVEDRLLDALGE